MMTLKNNILPQFHKGPQGKRLRLLLQGIIDTNVNKGTGKGHNSRRKRNMCLQKYNYQGTHSVFKYETIMLE